MNSQTLHTYIANADLLDRNSLSNLEALLTEYPYFQTAWMLYARNLYDLDDLRFKSKIKLAALHCPDRHMLYRLINHNTTQAEVAEVIVTEKHENTLAEIEATADTTPAEPLNISNPDNDLLEFAFETLMLPTPASDVLMAENTMKTTQSGSLSGVRKKNIDLLDKFISDKPKIIPKETEMAISSEIADYEKEEQDDFITETLAGIYIKQGHFEKALHTYEKLSLKYPEKSIYFAAQIKLVKELIDKNA